MVYRENVGFQNDFYQPFMYLGGLFNFVNNFFYRKNVTLTVLIQ